METIGLITVWAVGIIGAIAVFLMCLIWLLTIFSKLSNLIIKRELKARFYITAAILSSYVSSKSPLYHFQHLCHKQMISKGFHGEQALNQVDSAIKGLQELKKELIK